MVRLLNQKTKILSMQKKILRTIFNKSRSDHFQHLFESYEIETVYALFFDQLFTEALCQYFKISCIKLNIWDDLLQNNQRITRNSSRGLFKPLKHRTKTKEKLLKNSVRKALNFFSTLVCWKISLRRLRAKVWNEKWKTHWKYIY